MTTVNDIRALVRTTARRLTAAILQYPPKAERQAAIASATQARRDAEAKLAHTRQLIEGNTRALAAAIADALGRPAERDRAGTPSGGAR
jgi:hypothetical protein